MEEANCILCSRPGEPQFQKSDKFPPHEKFRVVRCPTCGLAWVSPRPSQNEIARYYPEIYSWKPESEGERGLVRRAEWWYRFHLLRFETRGLLRHTDLKPGDAVLDVGCSSGDRLLAMQKAGLEPVGVESSPMADYAREHLGLDVRRDTFEAAGFEAGRFRAVTLYNVIEHVHDPRSLLREAHRVLAPGGWLVVQCPNAASFQARLLGRRWAAIDVPRDLYYYTPALLKQLLESEGFEVNTVVRRTSLLHPPTAAISLLPWTDPQRFWAVEAGGGRLKALAARMVWAGLTLAVAPAVWVESAAGKSAIPTMFARKRPDHAADSEGRGAPVGATIDTPRELCYHASTLVGEGAIGEACAARRKRRRRSASRQILNRIGHESWNGNFYNFCRSVKMRGEKLFLQFLRKVILGGSLTVRGWLFRIMVHLMGGSLGRGARIYKGGMIIMMTREAGIRIGRNLRMRRNSIINTATSKARIEIGDNVWLGKSAMVTSGCRIDIEDDVIIGPHTVVCDVDHVVNSDGMPTRALAGRPIRICQGAWIAANCNIVKGVTIGKGAIIGGGSVVTKDIPAYSTAVGVPARVIRRREDKDSHPQENRRDSFPDGQRD